MLLLFQQGFLELSISGLAYLSLCILSFIPPESVSLTNQISVVWSLGDMEPLHDVIEKKNKRHNEFS